jgi:hypothetical protein
MHDPLVVELSRRQLDAYNRGDLEAFCACYHDAVRVLEPDGTVRLEGKASFRARYAALFRDYEDVRATVAERMALGDHVVEREPWSRRERLTGEVTSGEVLVRYTERDGTIALAEFLA